jgi:drug/metabolite transporter (DMT)-like permease
MEWLALGLIAAAIWGGVSVVDKVVIEKHIPRPCLYSLFFGVYGLISAVVVGSTGQFQMVSVGATLLTFLSGVFYFIYLTLYFAALRRNDAAVVVALGQITPLFATLWGYLIMGEVFDLTIYGGIVSVVVGAVLISLERHQTVARSPIRLNAALRLMVLACFVRSLSDLLLKYPLAEISVWEGFVWPRLGIFAGALTVLAFGSRRQRLWPVIKQLGWRVNLLIMGNEVAALGATLALTLAYEYGPLTLVSATGSTQPLFILLLVWLVNSISKGAIPDHTNRQVILLRLLSLLMITFGAYRLGEG